MSNSIWLGYGDVQQEPTMRLRRIRARYSLPSMVSGWAREPKYVEIRSGAIIPEKHRLGLYTLEVNTAQGLRRFEHALESGANDVQSEVRGQDWKYEQIRDLCAAIIEATGPLRWVAANDPGTEEGLRTTRPQSLSQPTRKPSIPTRPYDHDDMSSEDVLHRLQDESLRHQCRRKLIVEAEVLNFEPQQLGPLNKLLRDFIAKYRESNDPEDLVAVGAAIRKCVAIMSAEEALAYTACLLKAGPRAPVPLEVELELTKMVSRKLTANPSHAEFLPELADRLFEIVSTYLNLRLLARERYGAITLNAVLGLVLLQSRHVAEVLRLVSELNVPWFRQLLARRSGRLRDELRERFPGEQLGELFGSLGELESQVQSLGS